MSPLLKSTSGAWYRLFKHVSLSFFSNVYLISSIILIAYNHHLFVLVYIQALLPPRRFLSNLQNPPLSTRNQHHLPHSSSHMMMLLLLKWRIMMGVRIAINTDYSHLDHAPPPPPTIVSAVLHLQSTPTTLPKSFPYPLLSLRHPHYSPRLVLIQEETQ